MKDHLETYQEYLRGRGLTPGHIQSLLFQLNEFFRFSAPAEGGGGSDETGVTRDKILAYQSYLAKEALNQRQAPLSPRLLSKRLSALRGFCRFLTQRKLFLLNPARDLEGLKVPRPLPRYVPAHEEVKQMIESIPKMGYGLRDRALLELLYSTGIRAGELLHLTLYDIDLEGQRVLVRKGKGAKDRVVPLGEKARQALEDYLTLERPRRKAKTPTHPPTNPLFLTRTGQALTYPVLVKTLKKYRPNPGIRPHTLRHATALGMLKKGADIRHIQELLGHTHLETTQIYTQLLPKDLQEIHQKYHPRERKLQSHKESKKEEEKEKEKGKDSPRPPDLSMRPTSFAETGAGIGQAACRAFHDKSGLSKSRAMNHFGEIIGKGDFEKPMKTKSHTRHRLFHTLEKNFYPEI